MLFCIILSYVKFSILPIDSINFFESNSLNPIDFNSITIFSIFILPVFLKILENIF